MTEAALRFIVAAEARDGVPDPGTARSRRRWATRSARRVETLVDLDRHRDDHVLQTPVALPLGHRLDGAADVQASVDAAQLEASVRRLGERDGGEQRNLDALVERHRAACEQDRSDVDDQ